MLQGAKQKVDGNEEHQRCAHARAQHHVYSFAGCQGLFNITEQYTILHNTSLSAVYAVGLYVDPKAAKSLLNSKQAEISATSGAPEQATFDGG